MSEGKKYYCFCGSNCKYETMTKEQILSAITQAASGEPVIDPDAGVLTKVKETNNGGYITFWVGTQAQYNALQGNIVQNCLYIITDEAAQIQGGVGTAGSANMGDKYAMFEAIHGSAPRLIELGLAESANPQSILKAEAMLLRHICKPQAAEKLENALQNCSCKITGDTNGATCQAYTDALMEML